VWPKNIEHVENMRFSMMDAGDDGPQMGAPAGVRYRPGESRPPSAKRSGWPLGANYAPFFSTPEDLVLILHTIAEKV
jgi:hypothetical protein